jgi:hypothetical protein
VEEESTVGFKDDLEVLRAELLVDSREASRNVVHPARLTAKVMDESEMEEDSVYASPTSH